MGGKLRCGALAAQKDRSVSLSFLLDTDTRVFADCFLPSNPRVLFVHCIRIARKRASQHFILLQHVHQFITSLNVKMRYQSSTSNLKQEANSSSFCYCPTSAPNFQFSLLNQGSFKFQQRPMFAEAAQHQLVLTFQNGGSVNTEQPISPRKSCHGFRRHSVSSPLKRE